MRKCMCMYMFVQMCVFSCSIRAEEDLSACIHTRSAVPLGQVLHVNAYAAVPSPWCTAASHTSKKGIGGGACAVQCLCPPPSGFKLKSSQKKQQLRAEESGEGLVDAGEAPASMDWAPMEWVLLDREL